MNRTVLSFIAGIGMLGLWATACSGAPNHSSDNGFGGSGGKASTGSKTGSGGTDSTTGTLTGGVGGDFTTSGTGGNGSGGDPNMCAGQVTKAMEIPLDMFIMLDQSGSMSDDAGGQSKWQRVTAAITAFVQQPSAAGIGVGIQYFGLPPNGGPQCGTFFCNVDADCGAAACGPCSGGLCIGALNMGGGDSCNAADYAKADVPIALLPGNAAPIVASMGMHMPSTSTPTSAALQGSIDFCKQWQTMNPSHVVVNVFATDGDPSECDTSLPNIDAIAAAGVSGMPKILTYVIGVGPSLSALDGIAAAGGTTTAFHVDSNPNANQQLLDALNMIRGTALACAYQIPPAMNGGQIDYTKINVVYTPGNGGMPITLDHVDSAAQCQPGKNEWYYDNPAAPKQILLCPDTCANLSKDTKGEIDIAVGCKTKIPT